jgi:EpsI family protein
VGDRGSPSRAAADDDGGGGMSVTPLSPTVAGDVVLSPGRPADFRWDPTGRRPNLILLIVLMAITLSLSLWFEMRPETVVGDAHVQDIPYQLGAWRCAGESTDPDLMTQIGADSYVLRNYVNVETRQEVQLFVVYRRYGRREFNHNPDQCFPAGGYQLLKRDTVLMPWAGDQRPAVHMLFDGSRVERSDGQEGVPPAIVTYFFASGGRTEHVFLKQQMWMALERFLPNKNGWTLIRLNSPRITTDDDALAAQRDFMIAFGDRIRDVITTDRADDAKAGS